MFKQLCLCRLMPYTGIGEGPSFAYLARLFKMHTIERQFVQLEVRQPGLFKAYMRVRNSLLFRYNHYRNVLKRTPPDLP